MKRIIAKFLWTAMIAVAPLSLSFTVHAGLRAGDSYRGSGDNLSSEPGSEKCKLYDADGVWVGNAQTDAPDADSSIHKIVMKDGSKLVADISTDVPVFTFAPVTASSFPDFPELQQYEGDDRFQFAIVSVTSVKGKNTLSWSATGPSLQGAKAVDARCVFLIEIDPNDPTALPKILKCLNCLYFISF